MAKKYRICEERGCDKFARHQYTTCWAHSGGLKTLKEARRIGNSGRRQIIRMEPRSFEKPDPSEWVTVRRFCERNCDPATVGHHYRCAFWLWNMEGELAK